MNLFSGLEAEERRQISWRPSAPPSLRWHDLLVIDTETTGLKWWAGSVLVGIALGYWKDTHLVTTYLPCAHRGGGNLDEEMLKEWARRELHDKVLIGQNAKFDNHILYNWGIDLEAQGCRWVDTSHMAALLDDHRRVFNLNALAKDFLGVGRAKVQCTAFTNVPILGPSIADHHAGEIEPYAREDAQLTGDLYQVMLPKILSEKLDRILHLESEVIFVTCELERNPPRINMELLLSWEKETRAKVEELQLDILKQTGIKFTGRQDDWVKLFRAANVELPSERTGKKQLPSFKSLVLESYKHPLIVAGTCVKDLQSLRSKFICAYLEHSEGEHLRTSFNQLRSDDGGTVTGRYSSSSYTIDGQQIGANLQQVFSGDHRSLDFIGKLYPIKALFLPEQGKLWYRADAAQIEYRLMAHYANDPELNAIYAKDPGTSFHKIVWKWVKEIKEDINYSNLKSLNFSIIYGAGEKKLAEMMQVSIPEVRHLVQLYNRRLPAPGRLFRETMAMAKKRGYVLTYLGRRARFPRQERLHKALNCIIQGTAAEVMKKKLIEVYRQRNQLGLKMKLTVHDEICGDVDSVSTGQLITDLLNLQSYPFRIPILWNGATGSNWKDSNKENK